MKNKKIIVLIVLLCLLLGGFGYYQYDQHKRKEAYDTAEEALALTFADTNHLQKVSSFSTMDQDKLVVEYGTGSFSCRDLINDYSAESLSVEPETIDLNKVGENDVHFIITSHDAYGVEINKEYTYKVDVIDTQYPTIEIAKIWDYFRAGDEIDLTDFIESVSDPVDGELAYSEELKEGTYTIDRSEFIEDAAGNYFLMVCAKDKNGNESYNGFKVTIAGGREQSDEELDRLASIFVGYTKYDLDEGIAFKESDIEQETEYGPSILNGLWNSTEDEDYNYLNFEVDYPRVYNWGPLEATIKKNEGLSNDYSFVFYEGSEEETVLGFKLTDEDSAIIYGNDEQGNRQLIKEVFHLNDDCTVKEQTTKRKARLKVEVAATCVLNQEVSRIEEENRRREEEARKKAEAAAAAAQVAQGNQSSGSQTGSSESVPQNIDVSGYPGQVLGIVNEKRANAGLSGLSMTSELNAAAQKRAEELVSLYSHSRPDGSSCFTILEEYGISAGGAGENIAAGYGSPSAVMNGWMNSDGHRANILNGNINHIGIGCVYVPGTTYGYYWVQLFTD